MRLWPCTEVKAICPAHACAVRATGTAHSPPAPECARTLAPQVYRGTLAPGYGGTDVAVKVQRPDVRRAVGLDLYLMRGAAAWLRKLPQARPWTLPCSQTLVPKIRPPALTHFPGKRSITFRAPQQRFPGPGASAEAGRGERNRLALLGRRAPRERRQRASAPAAPAQPCAMLRAELAGCRVRRC